MSDDAEVTQAAPTQAGPEMSEVAPTPPGVPGPGSARSGRARSVAVGLALFLTCLSLILATTTWWLHETVLDTDHFVALTADLASDPAVQAALVEATVTQIDEAVDLGPIGSYVVAGIAREVYASDAFAKVWEGLMRVVHTQVVAVLRDDSNLAKVENGQIVVNLFPVIDRVLEKVNSLDLVIAGTPIAVPDITNPDDPTASRAELEAALGRSLRPTFGTIPIADAGKLEAAQRAVTIFDAFAIVLWVITGLLAILTLALARRRLRMVALLGIAGLAALLAARLVIASAADGIATALAGAGPGAIIGGEIARTAADAYREFARLVLAIALAAAAIATILSYRIERQAADGSAAGGIARVADGWFLALAGLCIALAALLVVGLTLASLVVVAAAYAGWLAFVAWSARRRGTAGAAA
jgi:hypothetical protein